MKEILRNNRNNVYRYHNKVYKEIRDIKDLKTEVFWHGEVSRALPDICLQMEERNGLLVSAFHKNIRLPTLVEKLEMRSHLNKISVKNYKQDDLNLLKHINHNIESIIDLTNIERKELRNKMIDFESFIYSKDHSGFIHGDMVDSNFLVTSSGLKVIDFELSGVGNIVWDYTTILNHELLFLQTPKSDIYTSWLEGDDLFEHTLSNFKQRAFTSSLSTGIRAQRLNHKSAKEEFHKRLNAVLSNDYSEKWVVTDDLFRQR